MKKTLIICIILNIIFFCIPTNIFAEETAFISGSAVRIRSGAGTENSALYTLSTNTSIIIVDKTLVTGSGCSDGWYKVSYNNTTGYVCSTYVKFVDETYKGINVANWTARVKANNVAVRKSASSSATKLNTLSLGVNVAILDEQTSTSSGCTSKTWYKIQYYGDKVGYMCKDYITTKSDITLISEETASYAEELKTAGFPDSYIPYLTYLHNKYPNWKFIAKNTNLSFSGSVDAEEGKNYMQTTNNNYRTSTKPAEGSTWYKINSQVISFYMDPRNWLSEERIFMFEKQDYSKELESIYPTLVKSIFGTGTLADDKYTIPMFNAGKTNKISPVLIASRIRLEVGASGSSSTSGGEFTWKKKKYSGYYNFFNIGAYETTINGVKYSAVTRGLAYAAKLINRSGSVWNNIETAITEGSAFLANGYVNSGQGTLYYQKFNVSPDAYYNTYTHQYMTNIQAPVTEGNSAYNSYKKSSLLNETFIFEIPIYNNMPEYTSLPNSGDTINDLSALAIEGYSISPAFDEDVISYEAYIPTSVTEVNVQGIPKSTLSTVEGTGVFTIEDDEAALTITVTSQVKEQKNYTINVYKVDDTTKVNDVIEQSSLAINDTYLTKLKNNTTYSTLQNTMIKNGAMNIVIKDNNGKEISRDAIIGTGYKMTITTAIETKEFTLSVNGDTSGDGKVTIIDLAQVQKHIKNIKKLSGASLLAADTSSDGKVTIIDLAQVQKHIKKIKQL